MELYVLHPVSDLEKVVLGELLVLQLPHDLSRAARLRHAVHRRHDRLLYYLHNSWNFV